MSKTTYGYKAFYKDMKNRYGKEFEEGKTYKIPGKLKFGNDGNGIHFCSNLEDTLRYVPGMEEEISIARVYTTEDVVSFSDEYYGYYDMYVASSLHIEHIMTREEIINKYLETNNEYAITRFLAGYHLLPHELELFKKKFSKVQTIMRTISYYQENNMEAFEKKYVL